MQKKVTHIVQPNDKLKLCVSKSIYYIKRNYLKQLKKKNLNEKKTQKNTLNLSRNSCEILGEKKILCKIKIDIHMYYVHLIHIDAVQSNEIPMLAFCCCYCCCYYYYYYFWKGYICTNWLILYKLQQFSQFSYVNEYLPNSMNKIYCHRNKQCSNVCEEWVYFNCLYVKLTLKRQISAIKTQLNK